MSNARFDGKVVFITGAGSGIGRATAKRFAAEGARVFAVDVNPDGTAETIAQVRLAGGTADGGVCDVSSLAATQEAVDRGAATFGGLDVVVNAAGVGRFLRFEEIDEGEWQKTLGVNLGGCFHTTKAALPHLLQRPGANVVNVASTAGMRGTAYAAHYSASKGAIILFTRSLALEFATRSIRFNCICPGGVKTPFGRNFLRREDFEQHLINYSAPPALGRFAEPEDIADTIAYLASDAARMINGVALLADGGTLA
jgi:NAD(P)-dependent dehydrogenase (short-subunit alcohol dehydrogenase family)